MFGFIVNGKGDQELSQMFVSVLGNTIWRPVPMIKEGAQRPAASAGWVPEEGEEDE